MLGTLKGSGAPLVGWLCCFINPNRPVVSDDGRNGVVPRQRSTNQWEFGTSFEEIDLKRPWDLADLAELMIPYNSLT
jgi:hypothetical protein